ncbi:MAG: M48 family metallopeptidase [Akkermansiaceae bacterium]|nr:M48 family metallopeptidase [Akkermansiaceae bacterium]
MNFYQAQDDARKRTKWLVVYFILAVTGVILSVYGIVYLVMLYTGGAVSPWMPGVFAVTAIGTAGIMGTGSLFKTMQLNGGGSVVARDMGARQIDPHTRDTDERRLVNVVEEMAIASGLPVPEIWIMDEELGINAFAAGTEPGNAVVAVTRGCLQRLSRSELQGVVAHEFSHILNGDMRLNMRLMGLLFGILMISMIGRILFESLRFMRVRSSSNDKGGGAGIVIAIVLAGVGLMIVGSVGVFFGRLIQAAISRQREFLADASAVQFTRDPDGIAGALMKIGGQQYGSKINSPKAAEASHLLFADGGMFSYGLATHPPLDVRIKALQKSWDGEFVATELPDVAEGRGSQSRRRDSRLSGFSGGQDTSAPSPPPIPTGGIDQLGEPSEIDANLGRLLRKGLQREWIHACHDREEAQALIFGLLLAEDNELREGEILFVKKGAGDDAGELALHWNHELASLHSSEKIALVDLSIPTLRRLSLPEYDRFVEITQWLIASDGQVDLFEFMLQHIVQRHLDSHFRRHAFPNIKFRRIDDLQNEANVLVTTMAAVGGEDQMQSAYLTAMAESGWPIEMAPPSECGLKNIESALQKFNHATPLVKKQLLRMLGLAVMQDGMVQSREAELLRATADAIGCSVPPFANS